MTATNIYDSYVIGQRLTHARLQSYLVASAGERESALRLYDWNVRISAALYEDLGRLEVVLRNALDNSLVQYASRSNWPLPWYDNKRIFPGAKGSLALGELQRAMKRARENRYQPSTPTAADLRGRMIAELNFGFWRYLCTTDYLTSLWVPALAGAFPNHPTRADVRQVRQGVEIRMKRLHGLRNRVAHHEPIHKRDLRKDSDYVVELASWICSDAENWIVANSRVGAELATRPVFGARVPEK